MGLLPVQCCDVVNQTSVELGVSEYILWLDELGMDDLEKVGGKNASLGEMITHLKNLDVNVPGGFATTAAAFRDFIEQSGLAGRISSALADLDTDDRSEEHTSELQSRGHLVC